MKVKKYFFEFKTYLHKFNYGVKKARKFIADLKPLRKFAKNTTH